MKVVAKPIEMIALFDREGKMRPIRFRLEEDGHQEVIPVQQVLSSEMEKYAGNVMYVFECQSELKGVMKRYQIKYELETNRWILFKI